MVFNATFNNISVILWRSVLMVEETGAPRENHRHVDQFLSHKVVSRTLDLTWIRTHNASNGALNFLFATRLSSDFYKV